MISIKSFVALEASLSDRLYSTFATHYKGWIGQVSRAIDEGDFDRATLLVNSLSLYSLVEEVRPYVAWVTNMSMLFGASRVTAKPGTSVVGLGYEKLAMQQAVESFLTTLVDAGGKSLRDQALQLIALRRGVPEQKADLTQLNSYNPKARILKPFGEFMDSTGKAFFNIASSLHNSRVSAYGFTAEANALGMDEYQITEQLDSRTCPVCALMHGKIFKVREARSLLSVALRVSSPEDLKYLQPWPSQSAAALEEMAKMPASELVGKGWHIPPFHPRCRGLLSRVGRVPSLTQIQQDNVPPEGPYTASQDDFEFLGYPATQKKLDSWNSNVGISPAEVVAAMRNKPLDLFLEDMLLSPDPKKLSGLDGFSIGKKNISLVTVGDDYGMDSTKVAINFDSSINSLILKELSAGELVTKNAMRRVLRNLYTVAVDSSKRTLAVDKSMMSDGYDWAKRGFLPDEKGWASIKAALKKFAASSGWYASLSPADKLVLDGIISSPNPASVFALVDLGPTGKKVLSLENWSAYLDVNDPDSVARFLTYLGG